LDEEIERHEVRWRWVKGHTGNTYNERVDKLAREAIPG
jgi:ribonuclease HI